MEIKVESKENAGFLVKFKEYYSIRIITSPTGNCQLCCICFMSTLLELDSLAERKEILSYLYKNGFLKRIVFVDINSHLSTKLENTVGKENIISKQPYVSSNGSDMIIYIINTRNF